MNDYAVIIPEKYENENGLNVIDVWTRLNSNCERLGNNIWMVENVTEVQRTGSATHQN